MDSKRKFLIPVLFLIVIGFLVYLSFFRQGPNDQLDMALRNLDSAQKRLDTALLKIDDSNKILDSMRVDFAHFQSEVTLVRSNVGQLNASSVRNAQRFEASLKEIRLRNQEVVKQLKIRREPLPEIKIYKYEN